MNISRGYFRDPVGKIRHIKISRCDFLFTIFLLGYSWLLLKDLDKFTPVADEAMHCLGGVVVYDFVKDFFRDPGILLKLKSWVTYYMGRYEIGLPVAFYGVFFYIMEMLAYSILGINVFAARVTVVLFSVLNLSVVYLLGRRIGGGSVGFLASLMQGFHPYYFFLSKHVMLEVSMNSLISLGMLFLLLYSDKKSYKYLAAGGVFLGFSIITSIRGAIYVPAIFMLYMIWSYGVKVLKSKTFWVPVLFSLAISCLWFIPSIVTGITLRLYSRYIVWHGSPSWWHMLETFTSNIFTLFWKAEDYSHVLNRAHLFCNSVMGWLYALGLLYAIYLAYQKKTNDFTLVAAWFVGGYLSSIGIFAFFSNPESPAWHFTRYQTVEFPAQMIATSFLVLDFLEYCKNRIQRIPVKKGFETLFWLILSILLLIGAHQGIHIYNNWEMNVHLPYDEAAIFVLEDSNGEISVLVDGWAPSFHIIVYDAERRVTIKTLQHLDLPEIGEYLQVLHYPDYIIILEKTFLRHQESFTSYFIARSYRSSRSSISNLLVLKLVVDP